MDPLDPTDAQEIVIAYARLLERDIDENRHPAHIDSLPYSKPTIQTAIRTSLRQLAASRRLTDELRGYFETAYVCLAEYVEPEIVLDGRASSRGPAMRARVAAVTAAASVAVAQTTKQDADALRAEFRRFAVRDVSRP
jgi:hypothetical protein